MSYVVFARRFRPQTLDQVVGQEHISRTLKNAILENRVAHAYLFSGPRGVGKTTTARILAKALNCTDRTGADPCGTCDNCREVTGGSSIDVQEIDGASNRGIDEIRALRDNVKFAPASSKHKVYIIDEAHQITDQAFNALLKTLEEPPGHVVFILATTEPQKIPITILSRCQRYRFRLLSMQEIIGSLKMIAEADALRIDSAALTVVANAANGSMRDALSLLDQAVSFVSGDVSAADVQNLLGLLPRAIIARTADALAAHDQAQLLEIVNDVTGQGYNLVQFARDLRDHLRQVLLCKVNPAILETTEEEKALFEKQHPSFTVAGLVRSGHILSRALDEMRWSDQPRLALELALLRLAQPYVPVDALVKRLEMLEKNVPFEPEAAAPSVPRPATVREPRPAYGPNPGPKAAAAPKAPSVARPAPENPAPAARPAAPAPAAEEASAAPAPSAGSGNAAVAWAQTLSELKESRPLVASMLGDVHFDGLAGNSVKVGATNKFQFEGIKRNQAIIEETFGRKFGRPLALSVSMTDRKPAAAAAPVPEEIVVPEEAVQEQPQPGEFFQVDGELADLENTVPPGLKKIADKFPGKITKKPE